MVDMIDDEMALCLHFMAFSMTKYGKKGKGNRKKEKQKQKQKQ